MWWKHERARVHVTIQTPLLFDWDSNLCNAIPVEILTLVWLYVFVWLHRYRHTVLRMRSEMS